MNCIITTTIYPPSEATLRFCRKTEWQFIIVGDLKTPHHEYATLQKKYANVRYLTPEYQAARYKEISEAIGWNTIQRRNIGFIEAYKRGAEIIATVDDDNIPEINWGKHVYVGQKIKVDLFTPTADVFDPLSIFNYPEIWHRGYPIELVKDRKYIRYQGQATRKVLVQADLWNGDPDIDAITRMIHRPIVNFSGITRPYCSDKISPFNSQNTFLSREVIPYYAMLPFVGRMDDIWGSYILQYYFPGSVIYGPPTVTQNRNEQNLVNNMQDELMGYRYTYQLLKNLKDYPQIIPEKTMKLYELYRQQFK